MTLYLKMWESKIISHSHIVSRSSRNARGKAIITKERRRIYSSLVINKLS